MNTSAAVYSLTAGMPNWNHLCSW